MRATEQRNRLSRPESVFDRQRQQWSNGQHWPKGHVSLFTQEGTAMAKAVDVAITLQETAVYPKIARSTAYKLTQEGKVPGHWTIGLGSVPGRRCGKRRENGIKPKRCV